MYGYLVTLCCLITSLISAYPALIITPVADLVGAPLQALHATHDIEERYRQLPLNTIKDCKTPQRLHQLLFNEIVEVLEEHEEQIKVRVPYLFYLSAKQSAPQDVYWTLKKYTIPLSQIAAIGALKTIPLQHNYQTKTLAPYTRPTAALIEPWHDEKLQTTFSFGTRFALHALHQTTVEVWRYNYKTRTNERVSLPKSMVLIQTYIPQKQDAINAFVGLLRRCCTNQHGMVAYVLGGCSFTRRTAQLPFRATKKHEKCTHSFYARSDDTATKNGFDCSGLITRCAQMAGVPYFYKNTFTAQACLPQIGVTKPAAGDLIWIPGHIMIISDVEKNLLIEARGYQHGYGRVHEMPLNKVFKDIETFDELHHISATKKPAVRLDHAGQEQDWYSDIKILSLQSCW